jgi:hypothetical protein
MFTRQKKEVQGFKPALLFACPQKDQAFSVMKAQNSYL